MQKSQPFYLTITLLCLLSLSACVVAEKRPNGYMAKFARFDKVVEGESSKNEVLNLLGSPSSKSTYGDETWYYISTHHADGAFVKRDLVDQQIVAVTFDKNDVVTHVGLSDRDDSRAVVFVDEKTPTEGRSVTVIQQLLGNLGKFNPASGR